MVLLNPLVDYYLCVARSNSSCPSELGDFTLILNIRLETYLIGLELPSLFKWREFRYLYRHFLYQFYIFQLNTLRLSYHLVLPDVYFLEVGIY